MVLKATITILCGVGLYASLFMLGKTRRAERGELSEPSVVQSPRARLLGGTPNALVGAIYYPSLAGASWLSSVVPPLAVAALAAAAVAAAASLFLAWSLLFITRRACTYCWTAHLVNWALLGACLWQAR